MIGLSVGRVRCGASWQVCEMAISLRLGRIALSFSFSAALMAGSTAMPRVATAAEAVAPFCIATGGGGEGSGYRTSRCEFFDYQQCLQAATSGGNCVQNIDYHGATSTTSHGSPLRSRRQRQLN